MVTRGYRQRCFAVFPHWWVSRLLTTTGPTWFLLKADRRG